MQVLSERFFARAKQFARKPKVLIFSPNFAYFLFLFLFIFLFISLYSLEGLEILGRVGVLTLTVPSFRVNCAIIQS
ncbi:hypothetical protein AB834_02875 [PVC group bacterium (ex Bugula neritina AB1)]|nr:hypothetical protein AB834_02875 [PVC group bacterium (ex Bugula neritina AB1)]